MLNVLSDPKNKYASSDTIQMVPEIRDALICKML